MSTIYHRDPELRHVTNDGGDRELYTTEVSSGNPSDPPKTVGSTDTVDIENPLLTVFGAEGHAQDVGTVAVLIHV